MSIPPKQSNPIHNGVGGLYIMWAEGLQRGLQLLGSAPGTSSVQSSASLLPDSLGMFVPEYRDTKYTCGALPNTPDLIDLLPVIPD